MVVEARAPCGDCNNSIHSIQFIYLRADSTAMGLLNSHNNNNNNSNNNNNEVILIKMTTDFIFMTVFPEIFLSSHEIIVICKQESARENELSEDRYMTPRQ
jgi:hypothetical protein